MPSPLRTATAAGLLAAGLFATTGGAVAQAEPDAGGGTDGSPAGQHSPASPAAGGPARTHPDPGGALRSALDDVANRLGVGQLTRPQPPTGSSAPTSTYGSSSSSRNANPLDPFAATAHITRTVTGILGPRAQAPAAPDAVAPAPAPLSDPPSPSTDGAPSPLSDFAKSATAATTFAATAANAAATNLATTATAAANASATAAANAAAAAAATAAGVVTATQNLAVPLATQMVALPSLLVAPTTDVLTALTAMLSATGGAVTPVTQLPTDLASLFLNASTPPAAGGGGARVLAPAVGATPTPLQLVGALTSGATPQPVGATALSTTPTVNPSVVAATASMGRSSAATTGARASAGGALPEALAEFLDGYGAMMLAASLAALAAAALPGILGFLIPTAAGVGFGYRQAKAGTALRTSGIARFAGSGPVGIVRSGALVTFRPRAVREMLAAHDAGLGDDAPAPRGKRHLQSVA